MKTAIRLLLAPYRFSVDRLFRMGEVGWAHWFDAPSLYPGGNQLYLYQDSAGTTPVTAVGQSFGLSLDRAYGGQTGASLLANGATGLTGTATAASYDTSTYAGSVSRAGDASNQSWVTWTGLTTAAMFRIRVQNTGATSLDVRNGGVAGTIIASIAAGVTSFVHVPTSGGSTSITITATANSTTATFTLSEFARVPGTHLIQATSPSRPTLSARVNGLLNSEDFTAASWTKTGSTISANAVSAPNGTLTADKIVETAANNHHQVSQINSSAVAGATYVYSVDVLAGERTSVAIILSDNSTGDGRVIADLSVGTLGAASVSGNWSNPVASISASGGGWYRVKLTLTKSAGGNSSAVGIVALYNGSPPYLGDGTSGIYVWGADLRTADDAAKPIPAYQRVGATAADHDTDGFPHGGYLDGTDDYDTSATGGGGTTGFFFCGVLTVSGGAGTARTIWSDTGTNTGYRVRINASNKLELAAGNGSAYTTVESNETITAPGTYLLSAWDDGGVLAVQVGNAAAATTARPAVSAGTSTITSYRDNGAATSYFNGRDYGSVYRQTYPGETMHARLKSWLARQARITR